MIPVSELPSDWNFCQASVPIIFLYNLPNLVRSIEIEALFSNLNSINLITI